MIALLQQKKNNTKANTKCSLSLLFNGDECYLYVKETETCKFNARDKLLR